MSMHMYCIHTFLWPPRLQVTCQKGHLSEMELCKFPNMTLNLTPTLTLTLCLYVSDKWPFRQVNCPQHHCSGDLPFLLKTTDYFSGDYSRLRRASKQLQLWNSIILQAGWPEVQRTLANHGMDASVAVKLQ